MLLIFEGITRHFSTSFNCVQVNFDSQQVRSGFFKEWSLVLHGTKDPPYRTLAATSPHSKLAIVKKAHEDQKMM